MKILALLLGLAANVAAQTLIGWNNLGMHCMDDDFSVFSILPPSAPWRIRRAASTMIPVSSCFS